MTPERSCRSGLGTLRTRATECALRLASRKAPPRSPLGNRSGAVVGGERQFGGAVVVRPVGWPRPVEAEARDACGVTTSRSGMAFFGRTRRPGMRPASSHRTGRSIPSHANVSTVYDFIGSGVFDTPVGADAPGPVTPGGAYEATFSAPPGGVLSFATMLVQSNDLFFAPDGDGIALYDSGAPITADVTGQVLLWDAGTEVDQESGLGADQAPRKGGSEHRGGRRGRRSGGGRRVHLPRHHRGHSGDHHGGELGEPGSGLTGGPRPPALALGPPGPTGQHDPCHFGRLAANEPAPGAGRASNALKGRGPHGWGRGPSPAKSRAGGHLGAGGASTARVAHPRTGDIIRPRHS